MSFPHKSRFVIPIKQSYGYKILGLRISILLPLAFVLTLTLAMIAISNAQDESDITILAFGDSLIAGYGLEAEYSFPSRLEAALRARGFSVRVINAGLSGDTTGGGLDRLDWVLSEEIEAVILELGANDALRGLSPQQAKKNLAAMIEKLQTHDLPILLAGMRAPLNLGIKYISAFDAIYPELARQYGVPLYPFFLEGVALRPHLNLPDGLHPNPEGVDRIVENILPHVENLFAEAKARQMR